MRCNIPLICSFLLHTILRTRRRIERKRTMVTTKPRGGRRLFATVPENIRVKRREAYRTPDASPPRSVASAHSEGSGGENASPTSEGGRRKGGG